MLALCLQIFSALLTYIFNSYNRSVDIGYSRVTSFISTIISLFFSELFVECNGEINHRMSWGKFATKFNFHSLSFSIPISTFIHYKFSSISNFLSFGLRISERFTYREVEEFLWNIFSGFIVVLFMFFYQFS